ncbi:hypothetical protein B0H17DRAFT_1209417 [Mycena rosella]|uniref:Uncharacterized protein n=1 Tax=Mycena rosella TaxID=1033263 RepID=A0AAD7CZV6_MYCRO|nr:hypothetical protein B0H17DRAFT_1209417 [Mycena rosella]
MGAKALEVSAPVVSALLDLIAAQRPRFHRPCADALAPSTFMRSPPTALTRDSARRRLSSGAGLPGSGVRDRANVSLHDMVLEPDFGTHGQELLQSLSGAVRASGGEQIPLLASWAVYSQTEHIGSSSGIRAADHLPSSTEYINGRILDIPAVCSGGVPILFNLTYGLPTADALDDDTSRQDRYERGAVDTPDPDGSNEMPGLERDSLAESPEAATAPRGHKPHRPADTIGELISDFLSRGRRVIEVLEWDLLGSALRATIEAELLPEYRIQGPPPSVAAISIVEKESHEPKKANPAAHAVHLRPRRSLRPRHRAAGTLREFRLVAGSVRSLASKTQDEKLELVTECGAPSELERLPSASDLYLVALTAAIARPPSSPRVTGNVGDHSSRDGDDKFVSKTTARVIEPGNVDTVYPSKCIVFNVTRPNVCAYDAPA